MESKFNPPLAFFLKTYPPHTHTYTQTHTHLKTQAAFITRLSLYPKSEAQFLVHFPHFLCLFTGFTEFSHHQHTDLQTKLLISVMCVV